MRVAITGSTGYLGNYLAETFEQNGHEIIRMERKKNIRPGAKTREFSLDKPHETSLSEIDAVIHCAHDFSKKKWTEIKKQNIENSIKFLQNCIANGIKKIFFISSLSAFDGCTSNYGRSKLAVEKFCYANGIKVLRAGLIVGDELGGITGILEKLCRILPILPYPYSSKSRLAITDRVDVYQQIIQQIKKKEITTAPNDVISNPNLSLKQALLIICSRKQITPPLLIPVPAFLFLTALEFWQMVHPKTRIGPDNLVSFMKLK